MIRRPFLRAAIAVAGLAFGVLAGAASGAQPASLKDRFELSADLEARVAVHQELVTHAGRSPDDFCKLAADTVQILDPVALELSRFGGSEHNNVSLEAIQRAYKRTEWLVPGLSLVATEAFTQTGIDYRWLAKLAPPEGRPVLRALGAFELNADGVTSWGVRTTDASACEAPERGRAALAALVKAWPPAPACLKDALRGRLAAELDRMVGWSCFCGDRAAAQAAVRKSARVLKGLPDIGGPDLADRWLRTAGSSDTHFNCRPS